jgi:hypothetical protein
MTPNLPCRLRSSEDGESAGGNGVLDGVGVLARSHLQFDCLCGIFLRFNWAGVAQLVEHLICNQRVGGSNPSAS